MTRKMGFTSEEDYTKFNSEMEKGKAPTKEEHRNKVLEKARATLEKRKRSGSGARFVVRDGPTTPMV